MNEPLVSDFVVMPSKDTKKFVIATTLVLFNVLSAIVLYVKFSHIDTEFKKNLNMFNILDAKIENLQHNNRVLLSTLETRTSLHDVLQERVLRLEVAERKSLPIVKKAVVKQQKKVRGIKRRPSK